VRSGRNKRRKKKTIPQKGKPSLIKPQPTRVVKKQESSPWDCEICGETTRDLEQQHLDSHEKTASSEAKRISCYFCYKTFAFTQSLQLHLSKSKSHSKLLSTQGHLVCQAEGCVLTFENHLLLNEHLKTHSPETTEIHLCSTCGLGFIDLNLLKLHGLLHLKADILGNSGKKLKLFSCPECEKTSKDVQTLQGHYNLRHGAALKMEKCSECGVPCASYTALRTHMQRYHQSDKAADRKRARKSFQQKLRNAQSSTCEDCGKELKNEVCLNEHRRNFHIRVNCKICQESFVGRLALKKHKIESHNFKDFSTGGACSVCGKEFPSKSYLRQHMQIHGEATLGCEICGKFFTSNSGLRFHQSRVHTDSEERKNMAEMCPHCGRTLAHKRSLNTHLALYHPELVAPEGDNGSSHQCSHCEQKFRWKLSLDQHIFKEHPNAPLQEGMLECQVCGLRMAPGKKWGMEHHKLTHMTVEERRKQGKVHVCPVCRREFLMKINLKKHLKKKHPENNEHF